MRRDAGLIRTWVIAFVLASVGGFGALLLIGCALNANACPFSERPEFTSTQGDVIWANKCAICHGIDGTGGEGPSLVAGESATLTMDELEAKIARGKPLAGMPRFKSELTEAQIEAVAGYVLTLRGEKP